MQDQDGQNNNIFITIVVIVGKDEMISKNFSDSESEKDNLNLSLFHVNGQYGRLHNPLMF